METNIIYNEDCLVGMDKIEDKSIDMILCDLPYGTTAACKWDSVLPFDKLWKQYDRIIKDDGVIALFGAQPFTSVLICSNLELYRYSWIWKKNTATGFLNCNYAPLKAFEDVCIFSKCTVGSASKNKIRYYPPGLVAIDKVKHNNPNSKFRQSQGYESKNNIINSNKEFVQKYKGYPNNILCFDRDSNPIHPTQKPVALCEYLINTYTKPGEIILDNCMGSGTTAMAAINTGRLYIGFELDKAYYDKSKERIKGV